jgi:glucokinase
MTTKLTLSIDKKTIEKAKVLSRRKGKSLSKIVEEFLNTISNKHNENDSVIEKIQHIIKDKIPNPGVDWKKVKAAHLKKKYGL